MGKDIDLLTSKRCACILCTHFHLHVICYNAVFQNFSKGRVQYIQCCLQFIVLHLKQYQYFYFQNSQYQLLRIGACRPRHTRAMPVLYEIKHTHITRTGRKVPFSPPPSLYSIRVLTHHRHIYSLQCSDKIRFPQFRIKCGIAKSCPGIHTALQAPMVLNYQFDFNGLRHH